MVRELYVQFTPQEIQEAFAQNRQDIQQREELERLEKERDILDDKILKFGKKL
jgi:hypothetical protein